ncbi:MAG: radical SAM protein [bacterium]|nr:radical SAM protein [bacterium]
MIEVNEVKIQRILNPTAIDLGEFVINPFMGCEFACLYCYVRSNRVISKRNKPWGEYVDVRINAPELLEKELLIKKPKVVLLGSTTECFQPTEQKYQITKKVLEILNSHGVYYVILTRSPYIVNYISLLNKGFCRKIYFTINNMPSVFKQKLEPKTPGFDSRIEAVKMLIDEKIPVTPYFSPLLPLISDYHEIFQKLEKAQIIEFECLNFNLKNILIIIDTIYEIDPIIGEKYKKMFNDKDFYSYIMDEAKKDITKKAISAKKNFNIHIHSFGNFFENRYS